MHRLLEKQEIICWESDGVSDSPARRRLETEHSGAKTDRILLQDTWGNILHKAAKLYDTTQN